MFRFVAALATVTVLAASSALPARDPAAGAASPSGEKPVCKYVVSHEPGSKPFQMCMTKAEWAAKAEADAKDPNRIICRYEDQIGSRVRANKVCMTAVEWSERQRLAREATENIQAQSCAVRQEGGFCAQ